MANNDSANAMDLDVRLACEAMKKGGVVIYPTDTIWGIGCDATRSDAVRKVFAMKKRVDSKALITLVGRPDELQRYVDEVPEIAYDLVEFSTKPLTIVYDRGRNVAPELLADDGSIGIRVTSDPFCRELCRVMRRPIVSTSANFSGAVSPASFADIDPELLAMADYVVTWRRGDRSKSQPSSVMKLSADGTFKILR